VGMTPTEWRMIREGLGLTAEWIAGHLDIATRTVERWEAGTIPVPAFAAQAIEELEAEAAAAVDAGVAARGATRVVTGGRGDMPARWQRAIAFRVRQRQ